MRTDNGIRISPKLCKFEPGSSYSPSGYTITLPANSQYAGHSFFCSDRFFYETPNYNLIIKGSSDYTFTLVKSEREPGKRYPRPKLTFAELKAEFAEHSEQFYTDNLPQALALVKDYANTGNRQAWREVRSRLVIGGHNETWFYVADDDKRRLGTKGVRILQELAPEEIEPMRQRIERYYELGGTVMTRIRLIEQLTGFIRGCVGWTDLNKDRLLPDKILEQANAHLTALEKTIFDYTKTLEREAQKEYNELGDFFDRLIEGKPTNRDIYDRKKKSVAAEQAAKPKDNGSSKPKAKNSAKSK